MLKVFYVLRFLLATWVFHQTTSIMKHILDVTLKTKPTLPQMPLTNGALRTIYIFVAFCLSYNYAIGYNHTEARVGLEKLLVSLKMSSDCVAGMKNERSWETLSLQQKGVTNRETWFNCFLLLLFWIHSIFV